MSDYAAPPREWQAPRADASQSQKLGWIDESTEQGIAWTQSQRGYDDWGKALDIISGQESQRGVIDYRSRMSGNRLKTNVRIMISGLANIRPWGGFNAGESFASYAKGLNKTTRALYLENSWDQSIKEVLAYSAATCSGWMRPVWSRDIQGHGNIELRTYGMPSVLPVQLPANGNFQKAYSVTLLEEVPIYEAHWRFPDWQEYLKPTTSRYWYSQQIRKSAQQNAWKAMTNFFRTKEADNRLTDQYIPLRWTLINDLQINMGGKRMHMGQPGASWAYEVPYVGELIEDGRDENGQPQYRKAIEQDCKVYPYRRLMISSERVVMYDGPAFNWHGQLDLIQFALDKWPWEPMGFNLVSSTYQLQKAIDQIDRGCMDKVNALQDLPLGYPIGGVSKGEADAFDPMQPRSRIGYDEQNVDQPFKPAVPPEVYKIHPETLTMRGLFQEELDYDFQTRDIVELTKAKALGKGMDQLEALIAANGPIVKDMTRGMEASLCQVGRQVGWLILQYMPAGRLMQYVGPENMPANMWDYDPASIIPSHLPDERAHAEGTEEMVPSKYSRIQRARWFGENVRFHITPHSLHELTQTTARLMYMQLKQRGLPISAATVMEACEVPNVKQPEGLYEQDRAMSEMEEELRMKARLQKEIEGLGLAAPPAPGGGHQSGTGKKGGRPPSGQAAPQIKQKGDGRPVITESS